MAAWTDQEKDILTQMCEKGFMTPDIMRVIRRSDNSINSMASKMRLSLAGEKPEIDMDEFARLMEGKK